MATDDFYSIKGESGGGMATDEFYSIKGESGGGLATDEFILNVPCSMPYSQLQEQTDYCNFVIDFDGRSGV